MNITPEFQELISSGKEWVELSRKRKFNFESILSGLYADASHFIYELLQNAEDENATTVTFTLFNDRLEVWHNGENFNFQDVEGIIGIGEGTKQNDSAKIGKFGVGFKSVYAVTKSPWIQSGEYSFRIQDFVVPEPVDAAKAITGTKIVLPFAHPKRSQSTIYDLVRNRLKNLGLNSLLFLRYIREIKWECDGEKGHYLCERKEYPQHENVTKVELISDSTSETYLVFAKPLGTGHKDRKVEVAYCLERDDSGQDRIVRAANSRLFAFFATEKETYLRFLVQAPFRTTPARDNISHQDPANQMLIREIASLVADGLDIIKGLDLLDVDFLTLLPIDAEPKEKSEIYSAIYDCILEKLKTGNLLPASDGSFVKADEAMLARGRDLIDLLSPGDTQLLFGRTKWLDSAITANNNSDLWFYLIRELDVKVLETEDVGNQFIPDLVTDKPDEWMIRFYKLLSDVKKLWQQYPAGILRTKPFIRLEDGTHVAPVGLQGTIQVFLPTNTTTEYLTVKRIIAQDEECAKFFQDLGIHEPNVCLFA